MPCSLQSKGTHFPPPTAGLHNVCKRGSDRVLHLDHVCSRASHRLTLPSFRADDLERTWQLRFFARILLSGTRQEVAFSTTASLDNRWQKIRMWADYSRWCNDVGTAPDESEIAHGTTTTPQACFDRENHLDALSAHSQKYSCLPYSTSSRNSLPSLR